MSVNQSVLFRTSASTDIQSSAGFVSIAGMDSIRRNRITGVTHIPFRAETVQVVTLTTTFTPAALTNYTLELGDTNRIVNGAQELLKQYTFQTHNPITVDGANAAAQRETINLGLVAAINLDTTRQYVTAASLGGGTGITITDSAGYYPVFQQGMNNRQGATTVKACTNPDGSGLLNSMLSTTTAAVYSFGIGADLALMKPVKDQIYGNLISGVLETLGGIAPTTKSSTAASNNLPAVSGQQYDGFIITHLKATKAYGGITNSQFNFVEAISSAVVDNGAGSATTNLAGYIAFKREFTRIVKTHFSTDVATFGDFHDNALVASATYPTTGAAITTTDNVVMAANSNENTFYINPIGTHTLLTPIVGTGGLQPYLDVTTQEGVEVSPPNLTQCPKQFVVGKTDASYYVQLDIGTGIAATDFKSLSIGFRKKAAYAVDQTAYEAASVATACLGVPLDTGAAPVINIITGPGSAGALTNTSTAVTPTASQLLDLYITVDTTGLTKFYVQGIDKTPLLAASYTFTAGLNLMPFISFRHGAGAGATPKIVQELFTTSIWRTVS